MPDLNPAEAETRPPKAPAQKHTVEAIKDVVQGLIGGGIGLLLVAKLLANIASGFDFGVAWQLPIWCWLRDTPTLAIVGEALMFSAGVELAYMLFTPGPDEAVQPLILGIAAAGLLVASDKMDISAALAIAFLTLAIGFLFYVRKSFVNVPDADPDTKEMYAKLPFGTSLRQLLRDSGLEALFRRLFSK